MENTNTMTLEQLEIRTKELIAPLYELQNDRFVRHYVDCQDDTIVGGISYQVTDNQIAAINYYHDLHKEQILNGCVTFEFDLTKLFDFQGNEIDSKIVQTQYGQCYVTNDGAFISCAKKQDTYFKKGYVIKKFHVVLKCQFSGNKKYDKRCIFGTRPVFDSIKETCTEIPFDGTHHAGIYWLK